MHVSTLTSISLPYIVGTALAGTLSGLITTTSGAPDMGAPSKSTPQSAGKGATKGNEFPEPKGNPPTPTEGFAPGGGLPALPASLVERIRSGSYVDLGDLLPEHIFEAFIEMDDKDKKKKKPHPIETFQEWVLGYTTWASTIVATAPDRGLSLLQYLGVVGRLARDNPIVVWRQYDKQFRQMAAAVPSAAQWGELNFQFLQWAKQTKEPSTPTRETCRRWNEGRYCQFSTCKRDHSCSSCGRSHRAVACPSHPTPYLPPRGPWTPPNGPAPAHPPPAPPPSR